MTSVVFGVELCVSETVLSRSHREIWEGSELNPFCWLDTISKQLE